MSVLVAAGCRLRRERSSRKEGAEKVKGKNEAVSGVTGVGFVWPSTKTKMDDTRPLSLQEVSNDTGWCANQSAGAHLNLTGYWMTGALKEGPPGGWGGGVVGDGSCPPRVWPPRVAGRCGWSRDGAVSFVKSVSQ